MTWNDIKQLIRDSGLRYTLLNKNGPYETVHLERPTGAFTIDAHLYRYEPDNWERHLQRMGIPMSRQMELF